MQGNINTNQKSMALFYQFTAQDIYNKVTNGDSKLSPLGPSLPNIDSICPELLILFGQNLLKYGNHSASFHAAKLEVEMIDLRYGIKLLTGKSYTEFTEDFMVLRVRKEVGDSVKWGELSAKAKELGFSSSGLYRFMKSNMKRTPSGWHWY